MQERRMETEERGNLLLAIFAGIFGVLIGGGVYFIMTKFGRIAFVTSIAGVFLSLSFYLWVRKVEKLNYGIVILFMLLNLAMIFTMDAVIFAQEVVKKLPAVGFSRAFYGYPDFIKKEGLIIYDYINIAIVVIGSLFFGYSSRLEKPVENVEKKYDENDDLMENSDKE